MRLVAELSHLGSPQDCIGVLWPSHLTLSPPASYMCSLYSPYLISSLLKESNDREELPVWALDLNPPLLLEVIIVAGILVLLELEVSTVLLEILSGRE